jgi:hypothetical protein
VGILHPNVELRFSGAGEPKGAGAETEGALAHHHPPHDLPVRIYVANHGTQLLVILHLRKHLQLPPAREFLLWYPMENSAFIDSFMKGLLSAADFAGTFDIRNFQSLQPRSHAATTWWLESARRLREDAGAVRNWLADNRISPRRTEVWADDPMHVYVHLVRGMFKTAIHVKFPHCFNQEDDTAATWKVRMEKQWRSESPLKRNAFRTWQRWASGVDLRMERVAYQRAYTFDLPSPWSRDCRDVSDLISVAAFDATYRDLSPSVRREVDAILGPIRAAGRPLVLLLLFGLNAELRLAYQTAITRMFAERVELRNCAFAVKVHPSSNGPDEDSFLAWLDENLTVPVHRITHPLNLEFMLPQLRPDYVLAGPCGALPVIRRLGIGRPIALIEVTAEMCRMIPAQASAYHSIVESMETW